jgi:hypothetical protein
MGVQVTEEDGKGCGTRDIELEDWEYGGAPRGVRCPGLAVGERGKFRTVRGGVRAREQGGACSAAYVAQTAVGSRR